MFRWELTSCTRRPASTSVVLEIIDHFEHVPETDAVSIRTTDLQSLVSDNWSHEELVVYSIPVPNHPTFLLTVTLSGQRSMAHCWIEVPAFLSGIYQSVSYRSPNHEWWWCLIARLLPGGYDRRIKQMEGHIKTLFAFPTCQKVEKKNRPSLKAPDLPENLWTQNALMKHHWYILVQTAGAPGGRASEGPNLSDDNGNDGGKR